ncbi:AraC family transcriptional regulator [Rhizobium sp. C4]|uniref:AraC family transcriptional regulator n=1 Tax=Rhizobium sp. C4 TaxID=1349800 RepID=UPI001E494A8D|nr:AraC family transcriptional regulator [Rhizobium sp. C4]MCD2174402.1 AraC family transcriptional regulator [Rhizobium sp. C4]
MPSMTWTAEDVDDFRRFDYYRDALCTSFVRLTPDRPSDDRRFNSHVRLSQTNDHAFTYLSVPDHLILRTQRDISLADDDNLYLNFILRGQMRFSQDNACFLTDVGHVVLVDNARPFTAQLGTGRGTEFLVCKMPRSMAAKARRPELLTDSLNRHPLFASVANLLQFVHRRQTDWDDSEIDGLGTALQALMSSIFCSDVSAAQPSSWNETLRRTRAVVSAEMVDPGLSIDTVAALLKMRPRTLQLHLAQCGTTFTEVLNDERCGAVDRLLTQRPDLPISEAAYRVGYNDLSTFYRAYNRKNGRPPRRS